MLAGTSDPATLPDARKCSRFMNITLSLTLRCISQAEGNMTTRSGKRME